MDKVRVVALLVLMISILLSLCFAQQPCKFSCPKGKTKIPNPNHVPTSNGCGAGGLLVSVDKYNFTACCDIHDICYDTCNNERNDCDKAFGECLIKYCRESLAPTEGSKGKVTKEEKRSCKDAANLFQQGSSLFGCGTYKASQTNACSCV